MWKNRACWGTGSHLCIKDQVRKIDAGQDTLYTALAVTFAYKGPGTKNQVNGEEEQPMESVPKEAVTRFLDNRGLLPPQPQIRTFSMLNEMRPGEVLEIHNDRVPVFLFPKLEEQGLPFEVEQQEDGSAKVRIRKK